jgi:hypothetical protein
VLYTLRRRSTLLLVSIVLSLDRCLVAVTEKTEKAVLKGSPIGTDSCSFDEVRSSQGVFFRLTISILFFNSSPGPGAGRFFVRLNPLQMSLSQE